MRRVPWIVFLGVSVCALSCRAGDEVIALSRAYPHEEHETFERAIAQLPSVCDDLAPIGPVDWRVMCTKSNPTYTIEVSDGSLWIVGNNVSTSVCNRVMHTGLQSGWLASATTSFEVVTVVGPHLLSGPFVVSIGIGSDTSLVAEAELSIAYDGRWCATKWCTCPCQSCDCTCVDSRRFWFPLQAEPDTVWFRLKFDAVGRIATIYMNGVLLSRYNVSSIYKDGRWILELLVANEPGLCGPIICEVRDIYIGWGE